MSRRKALKLVHFASTAWFTLSAGYMLVWALRQAGFHWWVIFSLSGHSALIVFMLVCLYLGAMYRGVTRSQKTEIEHPLTTSVYYSVFYDVTPFLGALAGGLSGIGVSKATLYLLMIAAGSFWGTFLVWIIVEPAAGLIEMLLPSSRQHRRKRLAQARAAKKEEQLERQRLLAEIEAEEEVERAPWAELLPLYAEKLAALLANGGVAEERRETKAVDIGVKAWQIGGLNCMQQLHSMAMDLCKERNHDSKVIDYISIWWDGIGSWRSPLPDEEMSILTN